MKKLIIILGPTAVGKTDYSIETALKYDSPIISCDSRQIYKEMSIGTAVPSAEQLAAVQHYFIHSHTVTELYTAGKYELEALDVINRLFAEGHDTLVMAGGSGFYVDALVNGLDDFPSADLQLRDELMRRLKEEGYVIVSAEQTVDSVMLDKFRPEEGKKYAVIFGNEVAGVSQEAVDASDFALEIPQFGTKHSLNVSVSVGVILWHIRCNLY